MCLVLLGATSYSCSLLCASVHPMQCIRNATSVHRNYNFTLHCKLVVLQSSPLSRLAEISSHLHCAEMKGKNSKFVHCCFTAEKQLRLTVDKRHVPATAWKRHPPFLLLNWKMFSKLLWTASSPSCSSCPTTLGPVAIIICTVLGVGSYIYSFNSYPLFLSLAETQSGLRQALNEANSNNNAKHHH